MKTIGKLSTLVVSGALAMLSGAASATLTPVDIFTGNVGLSIDGIGSNSTPVGNVQANIPAGSTILRAYLYSAGTPFPFFSDSPNTLAQYNAAGISLAGTPITNFSHLIGATSTRADIGRWFTARADITPLIQSLITLGAPPSFSWSVTEGSTTTPNNRIDGEVLVIAYSNPALPVGSVAILDGGQNTAGETTTVSLGAPLGDPTAPGFMAQMSIADSFSCCDQMSTISVNGTVMTTVAGNLDDGLASADGSLITVGGIGDTAQSAPVGYGNDQELYDLRPFLSLGDTSFSIFTNNETADDNIFFLGLSLSGNITGINATPEPPTLILFGIALLGLFGLRAGGISRR